MPTVSFTSSTIWTSPVTARITVRTWGAGGGGDKNGSNGGGGGGGGSFSEGYMDVVAGVDYQILIGSGGSPGNAGGETRVKLDPNWQGRDIPDTPVYAPGGNGASSEVGGSGGNGGFFLPSNITTHHAGGNGGTATTSRNVGGAGGGGGAGTSGSGKNGSPNSGSTGGAGGGSTSSYGGYGGNGGNNGYSGGYPGYYGGGGGGAGSGSTTVARYGRSGRAEITYPNLVDGSGASRCNAYTSGAGELAPVHLVDLPLTVAVSQEVTTQLNSLLQGSGSTLSQATTLSLSEKIVPASATSAGTSFASSVTELMKEVSGQSSAHAITSASAQAIRIRELDLQVIISAEITTEKASLHTGFGISSAVGQTLAAEEFIINSSSATLSEGLAQAVSELIKEVSGSAQGNSYAIAQPVITRQGSSHITGLAATSATHEYQGSVSIHPEFTISVQIDLAYQTGKLHQASSSVKGSSFTISSEELIKEAGGNALSAALTNAISELIKEVSGITSSQASASAYGVIVKEVELLLESAVTASVSFDLNGVQTASGKVLGKALVTGYPRDPIELDTTFHAQVSLSVEMVQSQVLEVGLELGISVNAEITTLLSSIKEIFPILENVVNTDVQLVKVVPHVLSLDFAVISTLQVSTVLNTTVFLYPQLSVQSHLQVDPLIFKTHLGSSISYIQSWVSALNNTLSNITVKSTGILSAQAAEQLQRPVIYIDSLVYFTQVVDFNTPQKPIDQLGSTMTESVFDYTLVDNIVEGETLFYIETTPFVSMCRVIESETYFAQKCYVVSDKRELLLSDEGHVLLAWEL